MQMLAGEENAETRDRTGDLQIFSLTLSQLSYRGLITTLFEYTTRLSFLVFEAKQGERTGDHAGMAIFNGISTHALRSSRSFAAYLLHTNTNPLCTNMGVTSMLAVNPSGWRRCHMLLLVLLNSQCFHWFNPIMEANDFNGKL